MDESDLASRRRRAPGQIRDGNALDNLVLSDREREAVTLSNWDAWSP